ncbi:MFS transporter [Streptomyces monticola]|uniref:MFS transporter n=1 Tax=Streptomyces monticola TaxID=2666263 RepID=A0ABW2JDB9_9ACTN
MRTYLAGAATARAGDEMAEPALLLAGLAATGSVTAGAALLAGLTVSAAVGGPVVGALLDRSARPGRLLAAALALYALALAAILGALGRLPFAVLVLVAVGAGLLGPALSGGWTSQLPAVVLPEALPRANGLDAMTYNISGLVGPALAGAVAAALGAPAAVVLSAALIFLAVPAAWTLPARRPAARGQGGTSLAADLTAGFRAIIRVRPLARATVVSVISCAGAGMLVACSPLLGERTFGAAGHGALLLSGVAASALTANALLARFPHPACPHTPCPPRPGPDTVLWCGTTLLAVALLLAATGHPALVVAAALVAGAGEGPQLAALFAIRHREAPERLRAQVFTTGASLKITGYSLGAALAGSLASRSLTGALVAAAGVQALALAAYALLRRKP